MGIKTFVYAHQYTKLFGPYCSDLYLYMHYVLSKATVHIVVPIMSPL